MDNSFSKSILLIMAIIYIVRDYQLLKKRFAAEVDKKELKDSLLAPAVIMTISLAVNGLAFMQEVHVQHIGGFNSSEMFSPLDLFMDQFSILLGTIFLFEIIRQALKIPLIEEDSPEIAGLRVQIAMYEKLIKEHFMAVLGLGTVFGVLSGPGMALFLGIELALMWAGASIMLIFKTRKKNKF